VDTHCKRKHPETRVAGLLLIVEDTGIPPPTQGDRDGAAPLGDRRVRELDQAGFLRAGA